ncbi:conserved protein of unknown function [Stenotrophomonas maltophilia]|nr:conserved protein of unknown function [Stenotrophomonas maltophilia]
MVGDLRQRRRFDLPAVRCVAAAHDHRHHPVLALQRQLHRGLADRLRLLPVGPAGQVAGRALQVIGQRPMHLQAQLVLDPASQVRGHAAQLRVPERVLAATGIGDEAAIGGGDAFRRHHHAVADAVDHGLDLGQERRLVIGAFGQQDDVRRFVIAVAGKAGGRSQPARVAAHGLVDENAGGGLGHRRHVQRRFAHRDSGVLGRRAEAGAGVGHCQVVVDGLGHADAGQVVAGGLGQLRDFQRGIGRVVAAVVEEPAHVVRAQHLQQAVVAGAVGVQRFQLHPARAEGATRGMGQGADRGGALLAGVDQLLAQRAEDAVAGGKDLDALGPGLLDHRCRRGIDDRGDTAGLGVEESTVAHASTCSGEGTLQGHYPDAVKWRYCGAAIPVRPGREPSLFSTRWSQVNAIGSVGTARFGQGDTGDAPEGKAGDRPHFDR